MDEPDPTAASTKPSANFIRHRTIQQFELECGFRMILHMYMAGCCCNVQEFCRTINKVRCVDSKNLTEYWKQMLMQVSSGAGLEKVSAIVSRYPSPAQLLAAYARCGSEKECAELVAGLEVRRTDNVLGGTRKVGPDIGRRIYTVLTQRSEDTLLTTK